MKIDVEIGVPCAAWREALPAVEAACAEAVHAALSGAGRTEDLVEVSVMLADNAFVRGLNRDYRGRDETTNVLSFPAGDDAVDGLTGPMLLGDIVLAYETVSDEAAERSLALGDHLSHLVVHGVLHLLGYDHEGAAEAVAMEGLETRVLAGLGVADPYRAGQAPGV